MSSRDQELRVKVALVGAARPNFVKVAPVLRALEARGAEVVLVHTGQHYDEAMSAGFFRDLEIREPDVHLGAGSGTHGQQIGSVMTGFEPVVASEALDAVVVVGDVNSTLACTLVAAQASVPVAHVEAGLRSGDRSMPEEINRICTDALSDWLLTPTADADSNLLVEGVDPQRIFRIGNVMIDSLLQVAARAETSDLWERVGVDPSSFVLVTLHRPATVDDPAILRGVMQLLGRIADREPVLFPIHPRTRQRLESAGLEVPQGVKPVDPMGYVDFVTAMASASVVLTDSGGVQEETTVLGVPCITYRDSTERPVTVTEGTNVVVGRDPERAYEAYLAAPTDRCPHRPALWDGRAGERVAEILTGTPPPLAGFRHD